MTTRPDAPASEATPRTARTTRTHAEADALVDQMSEQSMAASDAPSTWAGPDRP